MNKSVLYGRWESLREDLSKSEAQNCLFRSFYSCQFGSTYISLDTIGNESLYILLSSSFVASKPHLPSLYGIEFEILLVCKLSKTDYFLKISLSKNCLAMSEVFEVFSIALVSKLYSFADTATAFEALCQTCKEYEDFFKENSKVALSLSEEQGLFGELYLINRLLECRPNFSIDSWTGPLKNKHDFIFENGNSIEVKTSLKQNRKIVSISNDTQLSTRKKEKLVLLLYILEINPSGTSIEDLISSIESKLSNFEKTIFKERLMEQGIIKEKIQFDRKFVVVDDCYYKVDDKFPKLDLSIIRSISDKIYDLKYKIDLDGVLELGSDVYEYLGI